jgi:hypothetical protein
MGIRFDNFQKSCQIYTLNIAEAENLNNNKLLFYNLFKISLL